MSATGKFLRVLVAAGPGCAAQLREALAGDATVGVVGFAPDGPSALAQAAQLGPDIVVMDTALPAIDGFETTRRIMESAPLPVVLIAPGAVAADSTLEAQALDAGAVAILPCPESTAEARRVLWRTLRLMAEIRLVRRRPRQHAPPPGAAQVPTRLGLVGVGASTGGPLALKALLEGLGPRFSVPVVVVQHIAAGFIEGLAEWLTGAAGMRVTVGRDREALEPGRAYLAPDGVHIAVTAGPRMVCVDAPPEHGVRPSVAHLFRTLARDWGAAAAGVLLTGMGRDGAAELGLLRERGAPTFAQDRESSIVFGMPAEAIRLGAAAHVMHPAAIAAELWRLAAASRGASS